MNYVAAGNELETAFYSATLVALLLFIKWGSEKLTARKIAAKVEKSKTEIAEKVETAHKEVVEKVEENTNISRKAFTEANNFNAKLADFKDVTTRMDGFDERLEGIEKAVIKLARKRRLRKPIQERKERHA